MINFRLATHSTTHKPMVEVWRDDTFVASIYGHQEGIRVVSKYYDGIQGEPGLPPSVVIKFSVGVDEVKSNDSTES